MTGNNHSFSHSRAKGAEMAATPYFVRNLKPNFALPDGSGERVVATFDLVGKARPIKGCRLIEAANGRQFAAGPLASDGNDQSRVWNASMSAEVTRRAKSAYGYTMRQAMKGGRANG